MEKIASIHKFSYEVEKKNFLGLDFYALKSLDQSIDMLCNVLGEKFMDDALKEDYCPYFGVPWEAGLGLAQYLVNVDFRGKRVLELGSGLALPSFVASRNGGKVLATDFHGDVKKFLDINQALNKIYFDFFQMNWRIKEVDLGKFDYVIGADVLYENGHPEYVAKALIDYLAPSGKIILSDPGRAYVQKFIQAMNKLGLKENLTIEKVKTSWTEKEIFVFIF